MIKSRFFYFLIFSVIVFTSPAFGQWKTQKVTLQPGWNAVFLEVQPQPDESDAVFEGIPVESVWAWNRRFSSVQFIKDADTLMPEQPEWLHFFPPESKKSFLTNLFIVQGGHSYLIKLGGTESVSWSVTGKAVASSGDWVADSFNLKGFYVDPTSPPTFKKYFAPSPAHAGQSVYKLSASGQWVKIAALDTEKINKGEAYWVYCKGSSTYPGPISITTDQGGGLDFGRVLTEQTLRIRNETSSSTQITLGRKASESPPDASLPPLAGGVPLSYWDSNVIIHTDNSGKKWVEIIGWVELTGTVKFIVQPAGELALRLAVRRPDMASSNDPGALYQNLLEVTDSKGVRISLPVVARGMKSKSYAMQNPGSSSISKADESSVNPRAGLWVGMATIDKVSYAASDSDKVTPQPTSSEFQIRIIFHVDDSGKVRMLQQVTLVRKEGTMKPDPDDPTKWIVDQPGKLVLLTRDELIPQFSGAAIRDGKLVGRRISSSAFGFFDPVKKMTGSFDNVLSGNNTLGYNHPLNPFKHKYHPDHDNLDYDFKDLLPEGKESYTIVRIITLTFTPDDPEGLKLSGWGDTQVGGIYKEDITGLHKEVLHVAGTFRLHHVSRVPVLNDGK